MGSMVQSRSWRPVRSRNTSSRLARSEVTCLYARCRSGQRRSSAAVARRGRRSPSLAPPSSVRRSSGQAPSAQVDFSVDIELQRLRRRQRRDAGERVAGDDLAVVDDHDPVAEALGLLHVVGRVDERLAAPAQRLEVVEDGVAALRVDADRRLVEIRSGVVEQRRGDVEPPLHAAAEGRRLVAGAVGEAHELERLVDAPARSAPREAVEAPKSRGWPRCRGPRRARGPAARARAPLDGAWRLGHRLAPDALADDTSPASAPRGRRSSRWSWTCRRRSGRAGRGSRRRARRATGR